MEEHGVKSVRAEQHAETITIWKLHGDGSQIDVPLGELGRLPGRACFDLIIMTWTPEGFRATGGGRVDICCV